MRLLMSLFMMGVVLLSLVVVCFGGWFWWGLEAERMWVMEKGRLCQGSWFLFHFGTALRLGRLLFILNGWIVVRTSCDRKVIIIFFFAKCCGVFPFSCLLCCHLLVAGMIFMCFLADKELEMISAWNAVALGLLLKVIDEYDLELLIDKVTEQSPLEDSGRLGSRAGSYLMTTSTIPSFNQWRLCFANCKEY
ncbi:hypothetical protein QQP08_020690 [Theobroma cacao]|nr:hypothetical protein QQP08_020690 [Theobroma cacao]